MSVPWKVKFNGAPENIHLEPGDVIGFAVENVPIVPANQNTSARTGETAGECPCGWLVLSREKFCGKCGVALLWP